MGPVAAMDPVRQPSHRRFVVTDEADIGAVRRAVGQFADRLAGHLVTNVAGGPARGLPDRPAVPSAAQGRVELVATELATNLVRHGQPGRWVLARAVPPAGIELLAVDHGPGIADRSAALAGRTRTPGGLGCGLAAVQRASAAFDLHSEPGRGTTVLSRLDLSDDRSPPAPRAWGGISVGLDEVCGDGWAVVEHGRLTAVAVVDGLGHGAKASVAADAALTAFAVDPTDLDGVEARAHAAMRSTRGGAMTICVADPDRGELRYAAIGNVNGRVVCGSGQRGLVLSSGTLGLNPPPRVRRHTLPWQSGATLVLWTDGLSSRLNLPSDTELLRHDPAVVAAALHREHARERDDATVVVVRHPETP